MYKCFCFDTLNQSELISIIACQVHERGADMELFLLLTKLLMYFFPRPKADLATDVGQLKLEPGRSSLCLPQCSQMSFVRHQEPLGVADFRNPVTLLAQTSGDYFSDFEVGEPLTVSGFSI